MIIQPTITHNCVTRKLNIVMYISTPNFCLIHEILSFIYFILIGVNGLHCGPSIFSPVFKFQSFNQTPSISINIWIPSHLSPISHNFTTSSIYIFFKDESPSKPHIILNIHHHITIIKSKRLNFGTSKFPDFQLSIDVNGYLFYNFNFHPPEFFHTTPFNLDFIICPTISTHPPDPSDSTIPTPLPIHHTHPYFTAIPLSSKSIGKC